MFKIEKHRWKELEAFQGDLKKTDKKNLDKLKKSLEKNGNIAPVYIWHGDEITDDGSKIYILDGHHRKLVSNENDEVECLVIPAATKEEAKEKLLLINAKYADITSTGLKDFAEQLNVDWDTLRLPGEGKIIVPESTEEKDMDNKEFEEDYVPITKLGDHYRLELGNNWVEVWCNDNHNLDYLGDLMADMLFTDAPYGINYDAPLINTKDNKKRDKEINKKKVMGNAKIANDNLSSSGLKDLLDKSYSEVKKHLKDDSPVYLFQASHGEQNIVMARAAIDHFKATKNLIWIKEATSFSMTNVYQNKHETCASNIQHLKTNNSSRTTNKFKGNGWWHCDVLNFRRDRDIPHLTPKPVKMIETLIADSTDPGDTVIDIFAGSGSTGVAALNQKRNAILVELEPANIDYIVRRLEELGAKQCKRKNSKKQ